MATQQKPDTTIEPGVAMTAPASVGTLPVQLQQALELRKLSNQVAGKIAELNWGNKLDLGTRRAIADWGRQYGVDPTTEIHVLGGNIYLNAAYYLRRLAGLIERGLIEYAYADHIEHDERLDALGDDGVGEKNRRLRARIQYQVPDKAVSAVAFRVKLRKMDREIVGAKWCGGGTQKNDPVGDAKPVETSESRAARRAIRQIVTHVPMAASEMMAVEDAAETLSERIVTAEATFDRVEAEVGKIGGQSVPMAPAGDPYELNRRHEAERGLTQDELDLQLDEQRFDD